jgi:pimeloyl-ACP methyl ester carboxylesterase
VSRKDCLLLDQPQVLSILFYPRRDFSSGRGEGHDVTIPVAEDISIGGRLHIAREEAPLIVLFHGNGEIAADYDGIWPLYQELGISLLVMDYRGYGRSDGTPTCSALLDDSMAIYKSLPGILSAHGLENRRLFLMGRSLGSAAAVEIASHIGDEIAGLIIESGFASSVRLIERLSGGAVSAQMREEASGFDNESKMERIIVPTLIIHGRQDMIIPFSNGEILFNACASDKKHFVPIPGAGHNDLLYLGQDLYFSAIQKFISELTDS